MEESKTKHTLNGHIKDSSVAEVARDGFGHGSGNYENFRPGYAKEAIDFMAKEIITKTSEENCSLKYEVLELGAGTGKTTQALVQVLPEKTRYLATDPSIDFLNVLQSKALPIDIARATADNVPLGDNTAQNIVCGNSFHWFSNEESLREMHRVLVPGGKLILMWKLEKPEGWIQEGEKQRREVYQKVGVPMHLYFPTWQWRKAIDSSPLFALSHYQDITTIEKNWTVDRFVAYMGTISAYNTLPEAERKEYLDNLRRAILSYPDVHPDNVTIPFKSDLFVYTPNKKE